MTASDGDTLAKKGFPIFLYEPLPAKMRRLSTPTHVMALKPEAKRIEESYDKGRAASSIVSPDPAAIEGKIWDNIPLPSIADPAYQQLMKPKTLLDCCRCAQAFIDEHDLGDGLDAGELNLTRVLGHHTRANTQVAYLREAASNKDKEGYLLCLVNLLRLVCCMTNEAGLESVLSAAFSLKHETDMKKTFSSLKEAQDKAKQMRLTPEEAAKCIRETPRGLVRPDDYRAPDFRPLVQVAQTEQGRSEVSCVLQYDHPNFIRARPMILTDDTLPSHHICKSGRCANRQ